MCYSEVCKKCRRVINVYLCPDRSRHAYPERKVICSVCIQDEYRKRDRLTKLLRCLW
jgi:hypothetical protein